MGGSPRLAVDLSGFDKVAYLQLYHVLMSICVFVLVSVFVHLHLCMCICVFVCVDLYVLGPGRPSAGGPRMDRRAVTCPGVLKISECQRGPHRCKTVTDGVPKGSPPMQNCNGRRSQTGRTECQRGPPLMQNCNGRSAKGVPSDVKP